MVEVERTNEFREKVLMKTSPVFLLGGNPLKWRMKENSSPNFLQKRCLKWMEDRHLRSSRRPKDWRVITGSTRTIIRRHWFNRPKTRRDRWWPLLKSSWARVSVARDLERLSKSLWTFTWNYLQRQARCKLQKQPNTLERLYSHPLLPFKPGPTDMMKATSKNLSTKDMSFLASTKTWRVRPRSLKAVPRPLPTRLFEILTRG